MLDGRSTIEGKIIELPGGTGESWGFNQDVEFRGWASARSKNKSIPLAHGRNMRAQEEVGEPPSWSRFVGSKEKVRHC